MKLYVDETETIDYFIVTGLLVNNELEIKTVYKSFKKKASKQKLKPSDKESLFREFKSTLMDRRYQRIKLKMLDELNTIDNCVIYSTYIKKEHPIFQGVKEKEYIRLINKIVNSIDEDVDVTFDSFNKADFETKIIDKLLSIDNVKTATADDSQKNCGLQFVDNLCGVIRLHLSNKDEWKFYEKIENHVKEV